MIALSSFYVPDPLHTKADLGTGLDDGSPGKLFRTTD